MPMDLLTLNEVATVLGIKKATLGLWARQQKIKLPERSATGTLFYQLEDLPLVAKQVRQLKKANKKYFKPER